MVASDDEDMADSDVSRPKAVTLPPRGSLAHAQLMSGLRGERPVEDQSPSPLRSRSRSQHGSRMRSARWRLVNVRERERDREQSREDRT
eukprot:11605151-Karenia_brevis.AAC.1